MSHIDSFEHEIVGFFGGLPVYHLLVNVEDSNLKCTSKQLMIGGGSGEHPALVIENPLAAVAWFIDDSLEESDNCSMGEDWAGIIEPYLNYDPENILNYYDWRIETYQRFAELCKSENLPNPYNNFEGTLEAWLILGFGEFIYYAMPDLAHEIMSKLKNPYQGCSHMKYNNILLIPPNIPVYANAGNAFSYTRRNNTYG